MRRLLPIPLIAVFAAALAVPSTGLAQSRTNVAVGIGDQQAAMFDHAAYKRLKLRKVRYFIRWNAASNPGELAKADAFVAAANRSSPRPRVLMHISTDNLGVRAGRLPTPAQYRTQVRRLIQRYRPLGVREWGVWNEANHKTQPTWNNPRRAAQFFPVMRSLCGSTCTIVALDVLDQAGSAGYVRRWYRSLSPANRRHARIVGIHNYSDVNRANRRGSGTRTIVRAVKQQNRQAKFWWTETGGLVKLGTPGRKATFPCSEARARTSVRRMFTLARTLRRDLQRVYHYNWTAAGCSSQFDAGLTRLNGSVRPAYHEFRLGLQRFGR
jgi:hypothetical protein